MADPHRHPTRSHVVLLGDSVFDNGAYTRGEPDVAKHLRGLGERVTLLARDGATTGSLGEQVRSVPEDATHVVVSVGGNDVLGNADMLNAAVRSTAEALHLVAGRLAAFEERYRNALAPVFALGLPVTLCTVYNGAFEDAAANLVRVVVALFDDVILRVAAERRVPVIDLRLVCHERGDYANEIEPSGQGGLRIAKAIGDTVDRLTKFGSIA